MTCIHELPEWPNLTWDVASLASPLAAVRHKQGKHLGKMESLGFDLRTEANLTALTDEVVKSSAIGNESIKTVAMSVRRPITRIVCKHPRGWLRGYIQD